MHAERTVAGRMLPPGGGWYQQVDSSWLLDVVLTDSVGRRLAGKSSDTVPVGTLSSIRRASGLEHLR